MICSINNQSILLSFLRMPPTVFGNITKKKLQPNWIAVFLFIASAMLKYPSTSSGTELGIALGSLLLNFLKVGVLYVVASVLSTALGSATACTAVRVGLCTALSSVSSVVHVLASSVESIV